MIAFDPELLGPAFPFPQGLVIPVDKPMGWTSADVVRKVKVMMRKLGYRKMKVGHAGTLDPLATGVLLVCVGRATKRVDELQAQQKEYVAQVELGATTPSYDLEHEVDGRYPWEHITKERIEEVLKTFVGEQEQEPPIFSAKRIDGKRAYEYARKDAEGVSDVKLKAALVNMYEVELLAVGLPDKPVIEVRILCSKGTYIRSFARDLGLRLDSGGHLTGLRRTRSGEYRAERCLSLEDLQRKLLGVETKQE